ncbi:ABC-type dipeptide/oligopeptide/nickel transport system, permease component [Rubellimicrobium thermophilum DSM 16684]|uniref:ABC-type dipeptide/oligopeptide/nickel transport system, permease component n=1 Tax=Rubellimicrobium thermophilum DSM 16684 TaxID=1123069 RepID=S9SAK7_9RHOB|nr:ABC transporter permease [Rubellimicrobium thermophilum]EPX83294.1 ABC-type dipeptide/oligopeptide/nickel transport system, permease component [Rubellimicrobium thermophilum DSM 16684]
MALLVPLGWIAAVLAGGAALGWLFRRLAMTAAHGTRAARAVRSMPLTAAFGLAVILIYALVGLFAPLIAPFSEREVVGAQYLPWSSEHWLGTDHLGRDMFSRMVYGARNTVGIALATTALAFGIGTVLGLIAAAVGGWVDQVLSRIVDAFMAIPALIFAMLLLTLLGPSIPNMILVIAVIDATRVFRLARAVAMDIVVMDYVEAARLRGEGLARIIAREILPNAMAPLVAEFGLRFCFVFLSISALSFLGLGIQPPTADWGSMVRDTATLITFGDITPLLPAGAIALLTVAVNFVVDWQLHRASGLKD